MQRALGCLVVLGMCLAGAHRADAQLQCHAIGFTAGGPATFYDVDIDTAGVTVVGPVGFQRCSGMDISAMGTVVATCERLGTNTSVLVTIDPATGVGTEVGPTGLPSNIVDISFRPADGTLFAGDFDKLYTIDTGTGAGALVGSHNLASGGHALAFGTGWGLFLAVNGFAIQNAAPSLFTLDPATGASTFVQLLPIPLPRRLLFTGSIPWILTP